MNTGISTRPDGTSPPVSCGAPFGKPWLVQMPNLSRTPNRRLWGPRHVWAKQPPLFTRHLRLRSYLQGMWCQILVGGPKHAPERRVVSEHGNALPCQWSSFDSSCQAQAAGPIDHASHWESCLLPQPDPGAHPVVIANANSWRPNRQQEVLVLCRSCSIILGKLK